MFESIHLYIAAAAVGPVESTSWTRHSPSRSPFTHARGQRVLRSTTLAVEVSQFTTMQTIAEHVPIRPRPHSTSSQDSHTSGLSKLSCHLHHDGTADGTPANGTEKPHTLSGIAHRAIGDHDSGHAIHEMAGDKHNKRKLSGDQQDPSIIGGEHPGLGRNDGSGRISRGMPNTPWTNTKAKELKEEETGETEEESPEDRKRKQVAGEKMRNVMGVAFDAGKNAEEMERDQDQRETREDKDRKATQQAIERLSLHAEGRLDKEHSENGSSHSNGFAHSSQARKDQEKFFHRNKATARQPDADPASYPLNDGGRPNHRQNGNGKPHESNAGANDFAQSTTGHANYGSRGEAHGVSQHESQSSSDNEVTEKLPQRAPKENVNGDVPDAIAPTKEESPPGPRNDINLRPRVPEIQVSFDSVFRNFLVMLTCFFSFIPQKTR